MLLLTATIGVAQTPSEAPANAPRPVAELPLKLILGRVPIVQVTIGGSRPLAVLPDTGAVDDILNARIARELGLHVLNPKVIEQPGGAIEMGQVENVQLKLGSVPVQNLAMVSAPLDPLQPLYLSVNSWTAFSDTASFRSSWSSSIMRRNACDYLRPRHMSSRRKQS